MLKQTVVFGMGSKLNINQAVDHAVVRYGLQTEPELKSFFKAANVHYPPKQIALLAFKKEQQLQLWAKDQHKSGRFIHNYPLTAYSGHLGPKLKERDRQIPEGIYKLVSFNPFSSMHLSLQINYPNQDDIQQARKEGRKRLFRDIFLPGKNFSVGCLADCDKAIDQLFLLARRVGLRNIEMVIAPNDLRFQSPATPGSVQSPWLSQLYAKLDKKLKQFPLRKATSR